MARGGDGHASQGAGANDTRILVSEFGADVHGMEAPKTAPDDRYTLCLHLRSGDVQKTPYRSYEEARYAADLLVAAAREGNNLTAPSNVTFLYLFPPQGDVASVEIVED